MDFENKFCSPTTPATLIINLENNKDFECREGYIIVLMVENFCCMETFYASTSWQRNETKTWRL